MSGFKKTIEIEVPASAVGVDFTTVRPVPFAGVITNVKYRPKTVLTGADTNSRTLAVTNKGQAGSGNVAVASKAFVAAVNAPALTGADLTLSATAADLAVLANDLLLFSSTHVGTGIADPGGFFTITIQRNH